MCSKANSQFISTLLSAVLDISICFGHQSYRARAKRINSKVFLTDLASFASLIVTVWLLSCFLNLL